MNDLAAVNENLNWSYEAEHGIQKWIEDTERSIRTLKLIEDNGVLKTEGEKLSKSSGNIRRVTNWFTTSNTMGEAYTKIRAMINEC